MAQIVLQPVAVGVVVDQEPVDVGHVAGAQQVAHAPETAGRLAPEEETVVECQAPLGTRGESGIEGQVAEPSDPLLKGIDRRTAGKPVDGDQSVPVDLRIAGIGRAPRLFGLGIAGERGHVTVIVGHGRAGIVPVEHAITLRTGLDAHGGKQRSGGRQLAPP